MSGKSTFPGDNILDRMRHAGNDFTFEDMIPDPPPTPARKLPDLPTNLNKLSLKALEDLAKQNWEQTNDELALERRLTAEFKAQTRLVAECEKKTKAIRDRLDCRRDRLNKISDAIGVYEGRDANGKPLPSTNTDTTGLRSDAFITKEDIQGNGPFDMHLDADAKKARIANRLNAFCMWRGGRMSPLPNLPHTTAVRFQPPDCRPEDLFVHDSPELARYPRTSLFCDYMIRRSAPLDEILLYVDGSCLDQHISGDATQRKAGCAAIFKPEPIPGSVYTLSRGWRFRRESIGPTGEKHPQTSQRAELRAAIAALATTKWADEGWIRVTIASDSAYLVQGITENIDKWRQRGWRNVAGKPVANRDPWEALLSQVDLHAHWGCRIRFWLILREQNGIADELAKYIAEYGKVSDRYPAIPWIGRMPGEGE